MAMGRVRLLRSVKQNCSSLSRVQNIRVLNGVQCRDFSVSPTLRYVPIRNSLSYFSMFTAWGQGCLTQLL